MKATVNELVEEILSINGIVAVQVWSIEDIENEVETRISRPYNFTEIVGEVVQRARRRLEDCSLGFEAIDAVIDQIAMERGLYKDD